MSPFEIGRLLLDGVAIYFILHTINSGIHLTRRGFQSMTEQMQQLQDAVDRVDERTNTIAADVKVVIDRLRANDDAKPEEIESIINQLEGVHAKLQSFPLEESTTETPAEGSGDGGDTGGDADTDDSEPPTEDPGNSDPTDGGPTDDEQPDGA